MFLFDINLWQDVDLLQNHGINMADIKKLKTAGICTIKGLQMTTKKKLCAIKGKPLMYYVCDLNYYVDRL